MKYFLVQFPPEGVLWCPDGCFEWPLWIRIVLSSLHRLNVVVENLR